MLRHAVLALRRPVHCKKLMFTLCSLVEGQGRSAGTKPSVSCVADHIASSHAEKQQQKSHGGGIILSIDFSTKHVVGQQLLECNPQQCCRQAFCDPKQEIMFDTWQEVAFKRSSCDQECMAHLYTVQPGAWGVA